jgi:hypothetical protein
MPPGEAAKTLLQKGASERKPEAYCVRQALATLVGLEAAPAERGGFTYTHRPTGFIFELGPYTPSAEEAADMEEAGEGSNGAAPMDVDDGGWVAYNPLHFGQAYEVRLWL